METGQAHLLKGLTAALLLFSVPAQSAVLDFDDSSLFVHGTVVDSQYQPLVTISAVNFGGPDLAVIFDTSRSDTRDPDLEAPFRTLTSDAMFYPRNVLIIQEHNYRGNCNDGTCNKPDDEAGQPAGYFSFDFANPIELISLDFFDIEAGENGSSANNRIVLYDASDALITGMDVAYRTPYTGGDNLWKQLLFDSTTDPELLGIGRMDIYMAGSGAIDNLVYNVVPVPASLWLFGTALLGFIGYSRSRMI